MKTTFQLEDVYTYRWLTDEMPIKGIILISHGMVETAERYEGLAEVLNQKGYHVYAHDHYGHGRTAARMDDIGVLEKQDFEKMVDFLQKMVSYLRSEHENTKVFILGHSMGSFVLQRYIEKYSKEDDIDGVILSGTAGKMTMLKLNQWIVHSLVLLFGSKKRAPFLDRMNFGSYNKGFQPNRTKFDWLSRDTREVDRYIQNPYCGQVVSYGFFECLLDGMGKIHQHSELIKIKKDLPIYLFSGKLDPVGMQGKSVRWLVQTYKSLGIEDVTLKLYEGGRHEMLNEINREEVISDIVSWLIKKS